MPLTDKAIKAIKHKEKSYKVGDEKGLYLLIHSNGSKYWRMRYRFLDNDKTLAFGTYPEVALKEARDRCIYLIIGSFLEYYYGDDYTLSGAIGITEIQRDIHKLTKIKLDPKTLKNQVIPAIQILKELKNKKDKS